MCLSIRFSLRGETTFPSRRENRPIAERHPSLRGGKSFSLH